MKRLILIVLVLLASISVLAQKPKYIFFFIGDGMSFPCVYITELYNAAAEGSYEPKDLCFSTFPQRGWIDTYNTQTLVTDSAAAGTALACGEKTYGSAIGMDKDHKSMESITAQLKKMGWGTGIITTVGINHATPAAFYASAEYRNQYNTIFHQLIKGGVVDFAAGADILVEKKSNTTAQAAMQAAQQAGWNVLMGRKQCLERAGESARTLCLDSLGIKDLGYGLDGKRRIFLEDFTRAGIANMQKYHPESFFMMIEGGNIDHAAHAGDAASMIWETNEMDKAVEAAMEFYRSHPDETLILVTSDHETGGISLGRAGEYAINPKILLNQKISLKQLTRRIGKLRKIKNSKWEDAREILSDALGLWTKIEVNPAEEEKLKGIFLRTIKGKDDSMVENLYSSEESLSVEAIRYFNDMAGVQFAHSNHCGAYVPVYAIGCGAEKIAACRKNSDIPHVIMSLVK